MSPGRFLQTETYVIDPIETPGLIHAENLTEESAKTTEELLKHNNENYHIFFTMEDHMGVSHGFSFLCNFTVGVVNLQTGVLTQPCCSS